ncbi:MAG: 30S ribosomal protein S12 methylthiotransferase RimO [Syntrophales bacterium]
MSETVHMISLGCPKNLIDSEVMAGLLAGEGFRLTAEAREAQIILVNTCAFILPAREEAIETILRMAALKTPAGGNCRYLIVAGCLPQRYGAALARALPEVDLFLGVNEVPAVAAHLRRLLAGQTGRRNRTGKPTFLMDAGLPRLISTPAATAYLKIAEGCNNRCAYCVIPAIRGPYRSRQPGDILREAETLVGQGVRELIVTAQDTTAYGQDLPGRPALPGLLHDLASMKKLRWLRLLYTYPERLTDGLFEVIARESKLCKYIDMPIQHIDDELLAAMHRRGNSALIRERIARARAMIPGVALRTSLIVGFPGETPSRFNRLHAFLAEARLDHVGIFTYSREEGTPAENRPPEISEATKRRRRGALMIRQAGISEEINRTLIGTRQEILIAGPSANPEYPFVGRCHRQAPDIDGVTYVRGGRLRPGTFVTRTILAADTYDLYAG